MMKKGEIALFILTVVAIIVFSGCSSQEAQKNIVQNPIVNPAPIVPPNPLVNPAPVVQPNPVPNPAMMPKQPTQMMVNKTTENMMQGTVKEFKIEASAFEFDPDTITVKKGDKVRFILTSTDVAHGIGIREFNVDLKANAGDTKTAEFVADKAGTFTFFCNVFCGSGHKDMKGTLIVEE